jgi:hypothetical protein
VNYEVACNFKDYTLQTIFFKITESTNALRLLINIRGMNGNQK